VVCCVDSAHAGIRERSRFLFGAQGLSWILDANTLQVNSSLNISIGARHLASLGYMYGLFMSAGVYILLSRAFAARQTIVKTEQGTV
jgi:hypothetical protein